MNTSELGLIPVQQKGETADPSPTAPISSVDIKPIELVSTSISSPPLADAAASPSHVTNGDDAQTPADQQRPPEVKFLATAAAQIKRKRGRPRKYTFSPFPTQVGSGSHTRLSLPSSFPALDANGLLSNESSGTGVLGPPKKPRLGRPSKTFIPPTTNKGSTSTMKAVDVKDLSIGSNSTEQLQQQSQSQSQQQQQSNDLASSKFHSSATLYPKIISYPPQSPLLNGHSNGASSANGNSSPQMTLSTTLTNSLRAQAPVLMEYYNNPFTGSAIAGTAASMMPPAPPPQLPTSHLAAAAICGIMDPGLFRRLLPQAEAAVSATRAGGYPGPHAWTAEMVGSFIATLPGCQNLARTFIENVSRIVKYKTLTRIRGRYKELFDP